MKASSNISTIFNWTAFVLGLSIVILTLNDKIYFGHGLGDLFYLILIAFFVIIHLTLNLTYVKRGGTKRNLIIGIIFLVTYSLFIYKLTIGRGPESRWNGEILVQKTRSTGFTFGEIAPLSLSSYHAAVT